MVRLIAALVLFPVASVAQHPHEREVQRALIELDRRAAHFSANRAPTPLAPHVGQPLDADPEVARQLRTYERMRMAGQHVLQLPPPVIREKAERPLPLPGGPQRGVDPVALPGMRD
jgi:hypothetical protein